MLANGRLGDVPAIKRMSVELANDFLYRKRVKSVNEALKLLDDYERMKRGVARSAMT